MRYIIGYDLNRPRGENAYPELINAIQGLGYSWHQLDSTWVITSNLSTAQIRDKLLLHVDNNDKLFVAGLTGEAAWTNNLDTTKIKQVLTS